MAKRNAKTKPAQTRVYGETDADDSYVPPDRQDVTSGIETTDMPTEVVDFRAGTSEVVDDSGGGDGGGRDEGADDGEIPLREKPAQRQQQDTRQQPRERQQARGGDDDEAGLTRKMRQRLARERAVVNRERALREQAEKKLNDERIARQATEDRITRIERSQQQVAANGDVKSLKAQIDTLVPQIAQQVEDGNTKEALALQVKLGELQSQLAVLEQDLKYRAMNAEARTREEEAARQRRQQEGTDTSRQVHPADKQEAIDRSNEFKKANRHWWRRRENQDIRDLSVELDKEILADIADGTCEFEPYSDEHFEELAQRMHEEHPDIEFCDLDGKPYDFEAEDDAQDNGNARREARVQQNNGRRPTNGRPPQGRDGSRTRGNRQMDQVEMAKRGQVELTQEDFNTMRTFKMDPNNAAHKKAFAQQRARTILTEAARGGNR